LLYKIFYIDNFEKENRRTFMNLSELKKGEKARIIKIGKIGELKKRLIEMGITPGEIILFDRNAPLGDPQEFLVKENGISIRKEDSKNIEIELVK
jgi:ferrous iron transport protein A